MENKILALIGITVSIALLDNGSPTTAAPQHLHPRRITRPMNQPHFGPSSPVTLRQKPVAWRPHLQFAYEALISASQAMQASSSPDVSTDLKYLKTAFLELQRLPPIFKGHRANAMNDIVRAVNHLKRTPPSRQAVGFTEDAIANVQACMQMYP